MLFMFELYATDSSLSLLLSLFLPLVTVSTTPYIPLLTRLATNHHFPPSSSSPRPPSLSSSTRIGISSRFALRRESARARDSLQRRAQLCRDTCTPVVFVFRDAARPHSYLRPRARHVNVCENRALCSRLRAGICRDGGDAEEKATTVRHGFPHSSRIRRDACRNGEPREGYAIRFRSGVLPSENNPKGFRHLCRRSRSIELRAGDSEFP